MQNDLTDGVKWAVDQGIADPGRVVISGASYGGYAVMAGLAYTPELYCAGVNYVGATDIDILIPKEGSADRLRWSRTHLGDLSNAADRKRVFETSPVHFAENIRVPVLMAYGKNDPRVRIEHGYDMERALKKAGKTYEMIIEADEGHGFGLEENRIAFFTRVDEFLKKYVPPAGGRVNVGTPEVISMPATPKN
jgi:dipeptidyl aminopeptidase/acylaminoacyl peptidase